MLPRTEPTVTLLPCGTSKNARWPWAPWSGRLGPSMQRWWGTAPWRTWRWAWKQSSCSRGTLGLNCLNMLVSGAISVKFIEKLPVTTLPVHILWDFVAQNCPTGSFNLGSLMCPLPRQYLEGHPEGSSVVSYLYHKYNNRIRRFIMACQATERSHSKSSNSCSSPLRHIKPHVFTNWNPGTSTHLCWNSITTCIITSMLFSLYESHKASFAVCTLPACGQSAWSHSHQW